MCMDFAIFCTNCVLSNCISNHTKISFREGELANFASFFLKCSYLRMKQENLSHATLRTRMKFYFVDMFSFFCCVRLLPMTNCTTVPLAWLRSFFQYFWIMIISITSTAKKSFISHILVTSSIIKRFQKL